MTHYVRNGFPRHDNRELAAVNRRIERRELRKRLSGFVRRLEYAVTFHGMRR
jgi:hypothetical protein